MKKFIRTFLQYTDLIEQGRKVAMMWDNKDQRFIVIGQSTFLKIQFDFFADAKTRYDLIIQNFRYD